MDTRIKIELDKEMYECGSEVIGAIDIKAREPLCISKIGLSFSKTTGLRLQKTEDAKEPGDDFETIEKAQGGYKYEFEIYSNNDPLEEISSGHHRFPFKFRLRSSDSASSEIKGLYFDFLCDIKSTYDLHAEIYMLGVHKPMYTVSREIQIVDSVPESRVFQTTVKVSSPICFFSKKYDISFELDKPLYYSGECLIFKASSSSERPIIKQIECFIYEILNVSVGGKQVVRTKYIVGSEAKKRSEGKTFEASLRIPSTTPSTVTESDFSLKAILFVNINFHKGSPVKIKKYIHIVKRKIASYPELDCINVLEGEVYPEKIFLLS